jgi:hypothetical protein
MRSWWRAFVNPVAMIVIAGALCVSARPAGAGPGDSRGAVTIPPGAQCVGSSGTAATMIPGGKAGFPKRPVLLATSCQNKIFLLDVATEPATLVKTITTTVSPASGWGALAVRSDRGDLLACTAVTGGSDIYTIDFSPFNTIPDGTATLLRHAPSGSTCAGIAWDPQSETIYQSSTSANILHYPETSGTLSPIPSGCSGTAAGVGIAGTSLFVGCPPPALAPIGAGMTRQDPTRGAAIRARTTTEGS